MASGESAREAERDAQVARRVKEREAARLAALPIRPSTVFAVDPKAKSKRTKKKKLGVGLSAYKALAIPKSTQNKLGGIPKRAGSV